MVNLIAKKKGDDTIATTAQNGMLLGGVAAATATTIVARNVFPLRFMRILTSGARQLLDCRQLRQAGRRVSTRSFDT
eukprot:scaffold51378_cov27-Phaeocystis_antarctica.AAC.1